MPSSAPPTPFPVGSFRSGHGQDASPAKFLRYLETLIAAHLSDNSTERIPALAKEDWIPIIEGLSEHFLATFPKSDSELWNTLHEKIKLCSTSLDVIERAALRVDELFVETDARAIIILHRLFSLLFTLQTWTTPVGPQCSKLDDPCVLRTRAVETIGSVLKAFASTRLESSVHKIVLGGSITIMNSMYQLFALLHCRDVLCCRYVQSGAQRCLAVETKLPRLLKSIWLGKVLRFTLYCRY